MQIKTQIAVDQSWVFEYRTIFKYPQSRLKVVEKHLDIASKIKPQTS